MIYSTILYNKKEVKNITTILSIYDKNITKTATHNQICAAKEKLLNYNIINFIFNINFLND